MIQPPQELIDIFRGTRRGKAMRNWLRVVSYCQYFDMEDLVEYYAPDTWYEMGRTSINFRIEAVLENLKMKNKDFGIGVLKKPNKKPTTNKEVLFRKREFIGDAIIDGILAMHYIGKGYSRREVAVIIHASISNYMLGLAGKSAKLKAPDTLFKEGGSKYYGSAFEHRVGTKLMCQGFEAAQDYVKKWLIPIIDKDIVNILEKAKPRSQRNKKKKS